MTILGQINRHHLCSCQHPRITTGTAEATKQRHLHPPWSHLHLCHQGQYYQCSILHPQLICESHKKKRSIRHVALCTTKPSIRRGKREKYHSTNIGLLSNNIHQAMRDQMLFIFVSHLCLSCVSFSECPPLPVSPQPAMESHNHLNTFLLPL